MKTFLTIAALATTIISAPAFARTSENAAAYQQDTQYQQTTQDQGIPWVVDHAKGPVGGR